ncbi:hypothetical protein VaNZ11_004363 [Volvox africanus]|uniref:arginyltransferase n=1 Tax=Volvox africanus TaxID=51714 RepID=A0ABQ5RW54_9CHLO|nr:hypothetical protein VaNZ11_004363 [Volvox africanus]
MADPGAELSIVYDSGSGCSSCGYCRGEDSWVSHGMRTRRLTVYAYQDLIDQGWRRSGSYLYKPDLAKSCCKAYTIRLDVQQFSPDKGQRHLLRKWRKYLEGDHSAGTEEDGYNALDSIGLASSHGQNTDTNVDGDNLATKSSAGHMLRPQGDPEERRQRGTQAAHPASASADAMAGKPEVDPPGEVNEQVLGELLAAALAAAVAAGDLPAAMGSALHTPPGVRRCTAKQSSSLPADTRFTSAAAFPLASGAVRKATAVGAAHGTGAAAVRNSDIEDGTASVSGQTQSLKPLKPLRKAMPPMEGALSAQEVAQLLAKNLNGLVSRGWTPASGSWHGLVKPEAYALNGHVNIRLPQAQPTDGSRSAAVAMTAAPAGSKAAAEVECPGRGRKGPNAAGVSSSYGIAGCNTGTGCGGGTDRGANLRSNLWIRTLGDPPSEGDLAGSEAVRTPRRGAATPVAALSAPRPMDSALLVMPSGRLQIRMVPSKFVQEEFELYKRYQMAQHGDKPSHLNSESYTRFLVQSPLAYVDRAQDPSAPECGYGSFHQQYWLDGKLIAVGVVDVLPRCLSSVYFFWDTSLASLALGKFSALQEILWVQRNLTTSPSLHYYYMGFYIHTCPKMRYKAEYRPSDLLCPMRKVWVRITPQLLAAIEQRPFLELSAEEGAVCQPNLAAPSSKVTEAASSVLMDVGSANAGAGTLARNDDESEGAGVSVFDTLVLLPEDGGVLPFKVLRNYDIYSRSDLNLIEQEISSWRAAVGWAAPSLLYRL